MNRKELLSWLRESNPQRLSALWERADAVRRRNVGDEVHLRGLVEISSYCRRSCAYCGIRVQNRRLERYRMSAPEILDCAREAVRFGYGTVVLQAGEDPGIDAPWLAEVIRRIKAETPLAVTLSLGERAGEELALWREAGADRYLLRFETSNAGLYQRCHPSLPGQSLDRFALLGRLRQLDYEVGSGVMVGLPGQMDSDLANDIERFRELGLDMIGLGPYLPHPDTPLGESRRDAPAAAEGHVANDELTTYKALALTRMVCPQTNIPATTALVTLNQAQGYRLGLQRGANVVMPNLTPMRYRKMYEIYPAKACVRQAPEAFHEDLVRTLHSIGRTVGRGPGHSPRRQQALRMAQKSRGVA